MRCKTMRQGRASETIDGTRTHAPLCSVSPEFAALAYFAVIAGRWCADTPSIKPLFRCSSCQGSFHGWRRRSETNDPRQHTRGRTRARHKLVRSIMLVTGEINLLFVRLSTRSGSAEHHNRAGSLCLCNVSRCLHNACNHLRAKMAAFLNVSRR